MSSRRVAALGEALLGAAASTDLDRFDLARNSHAEAERLLASDGLLDLVGAGVLAETGLRALAGKGPAYRCCFVDPRHGEAGTVVAIGGGLRVPACYPCCRLLEVGRPLRPLLERRRLRRDLPYWRTESVWATSGFGSLGGELWRAVRTARWEAPRD